MAEKKQYGYGTRRTPGGNDGYTGNIDISSNKFGFYDPYERWRALNDYMDYTGWKREELQNLMKLYRTQFPQQMKAYQQAAMGELNTRAPQVWGQMQTNLQKRGLEDSPNFLAGARQDLANWKLQEKQSIFDTRDNMQNQAQQMLLSAVGQPNFAGVYQGWNTLTQQVNEYVDNYRAKLKKKLK